MLDGLSEEAAAMRREALVSGAQAKAK